MNSVSSPAPAASGERWRFLRDVMVFQLKLFLDNLRDFALVPSSLVAALIDLRNGQGNANCGILF
jgi:hypothetical protein